MGGKKTTGVILREAIGFYRANFVNLFVTTLIIYGISYAFTYLCRNVFMLAGLDAAGIRNFFGYVKVTMPEDPAGYFAYADTQVRMQWISLAATILAGLIKTIINEIPAGMFEYNSNDAALAFADGDTPKIRSVASHFKISWRRYLSLSSWTILWLMLWSLLFGIPGLVKQYSYMFAPYLLIQYPGMTVRQALKKSMEITNGYKGRLFLLNICVFGPFVAVLFTYIIVTTVLKAYSSILISTLFIPVTYLFLAMPVSYMMYAIAYKDIKLAAIEKGLMPPAMPEGCGLSEFQAVIAAEEANVVVGDAESGI